VVLVRVTLSGIAAADFGSIYQKAFVKGVAQFLDFDGVSQHDISIMKFKRRRLSSVFGASSIRVTMQIRTVSEDVAKQVRNAHPHPLLRPPSSSTGEERPRAVDGPKPPH
jgi:hypothetical protein